MTVAAAIAQLADELNAKLVGLAACVPDLVTLEVPEAHCARLVAQLAQDSDDRLSAQTVIDIMGALWPDCRPEDIDRSDWWRTPLGRLCARSLGRDDSESVTHTVAAAMLGIPRHNIGTMKARGYLDGHPDGGILRASVLRRIAARPEGA